MKLLNHGGPRIRTEGHGTPLPFAQNLRSCFTTIFRFRSNLEIFGKRRFEQRFVADKICSYQINDHLKTASKVSYLLQFHEKSEKDRGLFLSPK